MRGHYMVKIPPLTLALSLRALRERGQYVSTEDWLYSQFSFLRCPLRIRQLHHKGSTTTGRILDPNPPVIDPGNFRHCRQADPGAAVSMGSITTGKRLKNFLP